MYANNKVKKEYEEIIAKRNEEIKKITDKKTDVEMAETELKEVKKMKEKQRRIENQNIKKHPFLYIHCIYI